ncbi:adenylyl-sulfate kinase [Pseudomonas sp. MSSRFD41]|uniref:adenylyl-sulfate kinase n=1 Tax=Pseudomonas sp. MSSRFD41 TaxID=1310370 RepID=UPI00163B61D4|nr:adenylyl-sulfate kinase [Pseudomonas sp. MSSRFD41]MBC2655647.1 adenylyl-sulfate kinase [Pseudomonas sp. MSSRFD41]
MPETVLHPSKHQDTVRSSPVVDVPKQHQDSLRLITCGSQGDGKSTLVGRLLWELHQVTEDEADSLRANCQPHATQAKDINYALLVDGLAAEKKLGMTIDVTYRFFSTSRRAFIVADTPGHESYTRNMVTGASTSDVAVLVVDAVQGMRTQTRRHACLLSALGIRHVVLAINKMDLVIDGQRVFEAIQDEFQATSPTLGFISVTAIPVSALKGDNLTSRSARTPWYSGPTLVGCLEALEIQRASSTRVIFPVQWINNPDSGFCGLSGSLVSGELAPGDEVRVTASGRTAKVARLVTADGDLPKARAGDAVTLVLDQELKASRGDVLALAAQPLPMSDQFEATLVWMVEEAGLIGRTYELKLATQWTTASITTLKYKMNVDTHSREAGRQLGLNDIAVATLALSTPLVFSPFAESQALGGFILVDTFTHATVAAGMIRHDLRRAQNVHRQALSITRQDRERLNGHKGKVIWFTGLSGSGKSTIANALEQELHAQGKRTYILDGDNVRQGLNKDLGFTDADRVENIRRVAEVAKLMMDAGLVVMTAFISPFRAEREMARQLIGEGHFIEVFVDTPLEVCEQRDPKGLYKKARSGLLPNMTGINSPYEAPQLPTLTITPEQTDSNQILSNLVDKILHN